jgi:hypothetical protein
MDTGQALVSIKYGENILNVAFIFSFDLSSPSGIATCTSLNAIFRFPRQHCSRSSDPDKFTFFFAFSEFFFYFQRDPER